MRELAHAGQACAGDQLHEARRVAGDELGVLEVREQRQEAGDADPDDELPPRCEALDAEQTAGGVRDERRPDHEDRQPAIGVRVEHVAHRDEQQQPRPLTAENEEAREDERQKREHELVAVEEHLDEGAKACAFGREIEAERDENERIGGAEE